MLSPQHAGDDLQLVRRIIQRRDYIQYGVGVREIETKTKPPARLYCDTSRNWKDKYKDPKACYDSSHVAGLEGWCFDAGFGFIGLDNSFPLGLHVCVSIGILLLPSACLGA